MNERVRTQHRLRNLLHSALLLIGMAGLLTWVTSLVFGWELAIWALLGWALALAMSPGVSPAIVLRLYQARRLEPGEFADGYALVKALTERAGVATPPQLYYVPSPMPTAFTIGRRGEIAIAITDGLLRTLDMRELTGVLAHEISHIRNHDLWVMNLADGISRLTSLLAMFGFFLFFAAVPVLLVTGDARALFVAIVLILAPTVAALLQLALSRAREFEADLGAATLTGDPMALASALEKLDHAYAGPWERILMPGRRMPDPSLLRSHPRTEDRIARLREMTPPTERPPLGPHLPPTLPFLLNLTGSRPRWRRSGLWY